MAKTNHWGALAPAAGTLVAVGLLVLIMVVVEASPAEATFPGNPGKKIAYSGYDGQHFEIYSINPGGGARSNLPTTPRTTTTLPGGAVSREAPPSSRSGEGGPQR
jgi:hypothetical protein